MAINNILENVLLLAGGAAPSAATVAPAVPEQTIIQQAGTALSRLFGNALSTFDILIRKSPDEPLPAPIILGFMFVALLFLFAGWRIYRIALVMFGLLLGGAVGYALGQWICVRFTIDSGVAPLAFALILGLLLGGIAIPFAKLTVFIFCGFLGAVLVSYLCERLGLGSSLLWTFASFAILGLVSISLMRHAMILFTSLSGAYLLVAGAMAMLHGLLDISIGSKMDLAWPMIAWIAFFLLGVRTQARKAVEKKHSS